MAESLAYAYAQTKDVAKAQAWIAKAQAAGGNSAQLKQLQAYLQGQSGDYAAIARDAAAAVSTAEQAGQRPAEADLLRLADAYQRSNHPAYNATLEKLLAYYPKKDYWAAYLARLPRKAGFADRYALDVMRLKLASGTMSKTEDFMEMAQLALQAGYPAEAMKIVERGYAAGALGSGAEAERHKRLRDLALKQDAESSAVDRQPRRRGCRGQGRQCAGAGRLCVRDHGRGRQGHRPDRAGHRQGRPEAPRGRQAAPGHGATAVGQGQGQVHADAAQRAGQRRQRRHRAAVGAAGRWLSASMAGTLPPFAQALGDGIWCIDTGYHRPHYDAAYLLVDSGRAAFFDTGTNHAVPGCWPRWTHWAWRATRSTG